tara:strand:- start:99 stop:356 length:258 start_codon:yes stop_codon:yes gene_type:complete
MMTKQEQLNSILEVLKELSEDSTVPKNVKAKVLEVIEILKSSEELSLKISKALQELEEISDDNNLQSFTRTQIWNITSMLEKINS